MTANWRCCGRLLNTTCPSFKTTGVPAPGGLPTVCWRMASCLLRRQALSTGRQWGRSLAVTGFSTGGGAPTVAAKAGSSYHDSAKGWAAIGAAIVIGYAVGQSSKPAEQAQTDNTKEAVNEILERIRRIESRSRVPPPRPSVDVVLGAQWGDEGKGKLVDILSQQYDVVARVAGGSNAGHTIVVDGIKYKFHLVPSGVLNPSAACVIGNGVVVHLPQLLKELDDLSSKNIEYVGRLLISDRAHLVFDFHQDIDGYNEENLGRNKIGTTKKGIGPAYAAKINRIGVRVGDLRYWDDFESRFRSLASAVKAHYPKLEIDVEKQLAYYKSICPRVLPLIADTIEYTNLAFDTGKKILVEGANATMLDIDFGTYPYVTSSNPSVGSVCTGLGIAPNKLGHIIGTVKAYCTRVGEGPFPTEVKGPLGDHLRNVGVEFGTTTGRPRRCGWVDAAQLRYSALVNGLTALNLTKLDVLDGLKEIKIGVRYLHEGKELESMPSNLRVLDELEVEYETVPGWNQSIAHCRQFEELPPQAQAYVRRIEELVGVPVRWIGVGPGRLDVIDRGERFTLLNRNPVGR